MDAKLELREQRKRGGGAWLSDLCGARFGGDLGDGHISARDPLRPDCFWLLDVDVPFREASAETMVLVDADGRLAEGGRGTNMPGYYIHQPILAARGDVASAAHTHTPYGTPFAAEARLFEPITQESCVFFDDHALFDDDEVQVQSVDCGARIAKALGPCRGVVLRNHGLLTVGASVKEAVAWFVMMERVARGAHEGAQPAGRSRTTRRCSPRPTSPPSSRRSARSTTWRGTTWTGPRASGVRYVSTRGGCAPLRFTDAVLAGLAPDGGLLVPERFVNIADELDAWRALSFTEVAQRVFRLYADDIPGEVLDGIVADAFAAFDHPHVVPLVDLGEYQMLELFHGPTLSFKDVALQVLGRLFEHILRVRQGRLNIMGATSGDTGSAAIHGVRGRADINIFVLYPKGRVSALQERQMTTVADANVHCLAIEGSFDDCQAILKSAFGDAAFKQDYALGAVNSMNWARVLAQMSYYIHAALHDDGAGDGTVFSVPTGNFGNIFAGIAVRAMGVPIRRFHAGHERQRHPGALLPKRRLQARPSAPHDQPVHGHSSRQQLRALPALALRRRCRARAQVHGGISRPTAKPRWTTASPSTRASPPPPSARRRPWRRCATSSRSTAALSTRTPP